MKLRGLRLVTGLVLMLFVTGHMANLMLGMHSLAAMEHWRPWLMGPWRSPLGQGLLVGSALIHIALGLYSISQRRSLAMSKTDVVQLCLGLATPPLLLNHAVVMHMAGEVTPNFDATYGQMLAVYWSFSPGYALQQLCVVMVVWIHAAVGLYSWLVLKPVWKRIGGLVLPVLFAMPVLALIGFAESGKEVVEKLATDAGLARAHHGEPEKGGSGHRPAQRAAGAHPSRLRLARAFGGRRARLAHAARPRDGERRLRRGLQRARAARAVDPRAEPRERRAARACLLGARPLRHLPRARRGRRGVAFAAQLDRRRSRSRASARGADDRLACQARVLGAASR